MKELFNNRRKNFRDLLDENRHHINPFTPWAKAKEVLTDD